MINQIDTIKLCECGCEQEVKSSSRFVSGHNRRGTKNSKAHNEAISKANSGENNTTKRPEVAAKISKALTGKKQSEETKAKRIESLTNNTKVIAARLGNTNRKGTSTSVEARKNMSQGSKGKVLSDSHKQAIKDGLLKHFSNLENRIKRAKQICNRINRNGYQYKTGYVHLPRLDVKLFYRSSYEELSLLLLDSKNEVESVLTEVIHIPYVDSDGITKIYLPDFLVKLTDGSEVLIEVKPNVFVNDIQNICKFIAATKWSKENNIPFCVWTEDVIFSTSSTTTSLQAIVEATVINLLG